MKQATTTTAETAATWPIDASCDKKKFLKYYGYSNRNLLFAFRWHIMINNKMINAGKKHVGCLSS